MVRPRVRFAPSPTGFLHVGGAHTALFNWLLARQTGGTFILRIEDTDVERSSEDMVEGILDGLRWLGLYWDEGPDKGGPFGPYRQSERLDRYRAAAGRLVAERKAYFCFCDPEALKQQREAAQARGEAWTYDRTCAKLDADAIAERIGRNEPRAVRFLVPDGRTTFSDAVHGPIEVDHRNLEDFVLLRRDGHPTYQLTVVIDDVEMRITHVIRGDDHISNTPKQVLLYGALGAECPVFAHVPLILGPDKKRLSKRHGATSVTEYRRAGYLADAMVNFLALLGWSPGGDREVFTREELTVSFSLDGISGASAVFNPEKLDWFNTQHLVRMPLDEVASLVEPWLRDAGLWDEALGGARRDWFLRVLDLLRPRARRLPDLAASVRPFLRVALERDAAAFEKHVLSSGAGEHLAALEEGFHSVEPFTAEPLEQALREVAASRGVKAGLLIHATRVAVTGQAVSPGLFEVLELVGRNLVMSRLAEARSALASS